MEDFWPMSSDPMEPVPNDDSPDHKTEYRSILDFESCARTVLENSSDGVMLTSPNGRIYASNVTACKILGRTEKEIQSLGMEDIVDPTDGMLAKALEVRRRSGIFEGDLILRNKRGSHVPVKISSRVFANAKGEQHASIIFRDDRSAVSRKKKYVEKSRGMKGVRGTPFVGIALLHPDGKIKPLSYSFMTMLGYVDSSDFESFEFARLFSSEDEHQATLALLSSCLLEETVCQAEIVVRRKNGDKFKGLIIITPVDSTDEKAGFVIILEDNRGERQSGHAVFHGQFLLETFMEKSSDAVIIKDDTGRIVFVNSRWLECLGGEDFSWKGVTLYEVFPPEFAYWMSHMDKICLEQGKTLHYVVPVRDHKGVLHTWWTTKFPYPEANGKTFVCAMATNISDRLKADEAIRDVRKRYDDLMVGLKKVLEKMKDHLV